MTSYHTEDPALDEAIASAFVDLKNYDADTEEYQKTVDQITKLYKLKNDQGKLDLEAHQFNSKHALDVERMAEEHVEKTRPFYKRVDPNTTFTVLGNIAVAIAVIKYEQTGVISTKVMSFMRKI